MKIVKKCSLLKLSAIENHNKYRYNHYFYGISFKNFALGIIIKKLKREIRK
jgi:hypothetical protein